MVRWLSPRVLVEAALRVVVSDLFGEYADKREFQAALDPNPGPPLSYEGDEQDSVLWLDFVADLGDGFDSTYAMACLLGQPQLEVAPVGGTAAGEDAGGGLTLPRGRALFMGGDEVYPVASREEYENRFRGPYEAALPAAAPGPDLLAIPGNHDWYDGLTNFLRFFCSGREIGAWQTHQRRSYFAVQLPHRWWLLAIDIQLDTYIDDPQLAYFKAIDLRQGDRVIVVTGKPSWVKVKPGKAPPDSYKNLQYFEEKVVKEAGAEIRVTLTGDLHHYCRYRSQGRDHNFITSGGGGAYLYPTHTMPSQLELPEGHYEQEACFPLREDSERLTKGARRLFRFAPGLCATIGGLYAAFAASLFAAIEVGPGWAAAAAAIGLTMLLSLYAFADAETAGGKWRRGTGHCLAHLVLAAVPVAVAALLGGADWLILPASAVAAGLGYLGGGFVFGEYLILMHRDAEKHANEVLACQGIPDYKNFLRLRLDEEGLTIYPIGIRQVPRRWQADPAGDAGDPWLRPAEGTLATELIEPPIRISAEGSG